MTIHLVDLSVLLLVLFYVVASDCPEKYDVKFNLINIQTLTIYH